MDERKLLIDVFLEKNSQINLSAIRDSEGVYMKHILDSVELTKIIDLSQYTTLCDVGTGGGFPLLALAQFAQKHRFGLHLTGLDARRKKIQAVQDIADQLGLQNVSTIRSRIEDHSKIYELVTARAVAYADKIIPRSLPLVKKGGLLVLYKELKTEEKQDIIKQCHEYQLTLVQEHRYRLFESDIERVIYVLEKQ